MRDASREMGAGESRQAEHGGIGTRWTRATGEQMAAGRPGNAPPTPGRHGDRRRARGVAKSPSSARGWVQARLASVREGDVASDCRFEHPQSPPACANAPSAARFRVVVACDLSSAQPVEGRASPTFCLPGRRPTLGQPSARRARKVAEGAASGVGVTGARARPPSARLWLERGTAATAELRESRW